MHRAAVRIWAKLRSKRNWRNGSATCLAWTTGLRCPCSIERSDLSAEVVQMVWVLLMMGALTAHFFISTKLLTYLQTKWSIFSLTHQDLHCQHCMSRGRLHPQVLENYWLPLTHNQEAALQETHDHIPFLNRDTTGTVKAISSTILPNPWPRMLQPIKGDNTPLKARAEPLLTLSQCNRCFSLTLLWIWL